MLGEVLHSLNNWFEVPGKRLTGFFQVEGGALTLPDGWLLDGQYFLVSGSVMNDGLHQWPAYDLVDEGFEGEVQALAVPMAVQDLADRIEIWWEKYGKAAESPYQSESFGRRVSDGEGGFATVWAPSAPFEAAIVHDDSTQARIAEKEGVTSLYTVTTKAPLGFHDVFTRKSDGQAFRVTSNAEDGKTPSMVSFQFSQCQAEAWEVPNE